MTLTELGAQFREIRVHRGLSIDEVVRSLKISPATVRALEDGDREALPELVFLRGFIRAYGSFLGFSASDLQRALENIETQEPKFKPTPLKGDKIGYISNVKQQRSPVKLLLQAAFVLLFIFLGYSAIDFFIKNDTLTQVKGFFSSDEVAEKTTVEEKTGFRVAQEESFTEEVSVETFAVSPKSEFVETSEIQDIAETDTVLTSEELASEEIILDEAIVATNDEPAGLTEEKEVVLLTEESSVAEEVALAQAPVVIEAVPVVQEEISIQANNNSASKVAKSLGSGSQSVQVLALEDCWMRVDLDAARVRTDFTLLSGTTAELAFNNVAELRLGNAGGVEITYNNVKQASPGNRGQVTTVRYSK